MKRVTHEETADEEEQQLKSIARRFGLVSGIVAVVLLLAGCGGGNVPPFVTGDHLTQIEVINNQTGQKGLASKEADNLYALLDLLHLGNITADRRQDAPVPTTAMYTIVVHDATQVVWSVRVLDAPQSSRVYLNDTMHPANNGIYPLRQPIIIADLHQFVQHFPAP
jgi:hypothetical protein